MIFTKTTPNFNDSHFQKIDQPQEIYNKNHELSKKHLY